ncbi:MAG: DNA adenine methylase [Flavobacteriales bacterium]|nr:DNA adenine methylase [Flavobacteriales bacterium]
MTKTPISYYGGKQNMLKHILPLIPDHKIFTETYFGGGALFFFPKHHPNLKSLTILI